MKQEAKEWRLSRFGAGFDEAAEHFGDLRAAVPRGGGGLFVKAADFLSTGPQKNVSIKPPP
jgi:hypothetical protein